MAHYRLRPASEIRRALAWVCGMVAAVFLAFAFFFWREVLPRIYELPERYVSRARYELARGGDAVGAVATLRQGIDFFLPDDDGPYAALAQALQAAGASNEAALTLCRRRFQSYLRARGEGIAAQHVRAALGEARAYADYGAELEARVGAAFADAWALFLHAVCPPGEERRALEALTAAERLLVLDLAGWRIAADGAIGATGVRAGEPLLVASAGFHVGRRALVGVGDRLVRLAGPGVREWRGMALVVLTPPELNLRQLAVYDVYQGDAALTEEIAGFLRAEARTGDIVAVAVADEASRALDQPLFFANLELIGVALPPRALQFQPYLRFQESFAALGVRGAPPGSALHVHGRRDDWPVGIIVLPPAGSP